MQVGTGHAKRSNVAKEGGEPLSRRSNPLIVERLS